MAIKSRFYYRLPGRTVQIRPAASCAGWVASSKPNILVVVRMLAVTSPGQPCHPNSETPLEGEALMRVLAAPNACPAC